MRSMRPATWWPSAPFWWIGYEVPYLRWQGVPDVQTVPTSETWLQRGEMPRLGGCGLMNTPVSCLTCGRVLRCKHAPEVAMSIFLRVRRLTEAPAIFEATAQNCPEHKKGRKKNTAQLELFS